MKLRLLSLAFAVMGRICQGTCGLHRAADRVHERLLRACTRANLATLTRRKQQRERFN